MFGVPKGPFVLAAISLIIAIIETVTGDVGMIPPEGFSRTSTNLAQLAIGIHMILGNDILTDPTE